MAVCFDLLKTHRKPSEPLETPKLVQIFGRTRYAAAPKLELLVAGTETL